jgi:hypothetical protein
MAFATSARIVGNPEADRHAPQLLDKSPYHLSTVGMGDFERYGLVTSSIESCTFRIPVALVSCDIPKFTGNPVGWHLRGSTVHCLGCNKCQ